MGVYRLLLFRVLFGFGKFKFLGSTSYRTAATLKGFLVNQPLPSPIGWFMQKLLMVPFLKPALYLMFLIEIPAARSAGVRAWRFSLAAALSDRRVHARHLVVRNVRLLQPDHDGRLAELVRCADGACRSRRRSSSLHGRVLLHALILCHVVGSVLSFPFNSYCSMTWMNWLPCGCAFARDILVAPITFYRALHPFPLAALLRRLFPPSLRLR